MIDKDTPSYKVLDSTKINTYLDCPRQYFYQYVLGWDTDRSNIHLEFGIAWHYAMETLLLEGYTEEAVINGWTALVEHYRKHFPPEEDAVLAPKNPEMALRALTGYIEEYMNRDRNDKVLYTEIAGTVPVTERNVLHFRMDSIIETERGIISREHKTGSMLSRVWTDQWAQSIQTGTYNHVLHCLFPAEKIGGVEINGTFFGKKEIKYQRVPCRRSIPMMKDWMWTTVQIMNLIEWDMHRLFDEAREGDEIMMAFTKNPQACTKYFGCRYADFCMAWANPLQYSDEVPQGFTIRHWDPSHPEKPIKNTFTLKGGEYAT